MGPARPGAGTRIAQQVRQPPPAFPRRCLCRPSRARHTPRGLPSHPLMPTCAPPCPRAVGRQGARDEAGSARAGARREASQRAHRRRGGRHAGAFAKPGRSAAVLAHIPSIYIYLANAPATKPPRAVDYSSARPTRARRRRSSRCTHFKMPAAVLPERGASSQLRQAVALYNRWHYIGLLKALEELESRV